MIDGDEYDPDIAYKGIQIIYELNKDMMKR